MKRACVPSISPAHLAEAGGDELLFDKIIDIVGSPVSRWRRLIVPE